jgi:hypothetical protein
MLEYGYKEKEKDRKYDYKTRISTG